MPYVVAIKDSAARRNEAVSRFADENGRTPRLESRAAAESLAHRLSADADPSVRIQRAAPNDAGDVDAYLVPAPDRRIREPAVTEDGTRVFDVGATVYGAIGEAIVAGAGRNPPLLTDYAAGDLDLPRSALEVDVETDLEAVSVPTADGGTARWRPDCVATVRRSGGDAVLAEYWGEVKTGRATLERSQRAAMRRRATDVTVLLVRVSLEDLPDRYAATIEEIPGDDGDGGDPGTRRTRLDDF